MNKSEILFEEAKKYIPGGVNSPVRAFKAVKKTPFFVEKAKGAYIYDVDENEYVDYVCSWGPGIVGHAHPRVVEAVKNVCEKGLTFGAPTENELKLAKLMKQCVPSMEMTRLVSSGTEAVMSAIRVARGFTRRNKIIKFAGCYHGHSDGLLVKAGSGLLTASIPDSAGIPEGYAKYTLIANYNDEESVEKLMQEHGNDVACIVIEPVAANMGVIPPKKGFLEFLREITKKFDSLLIFDEVITGFRLALGGAQGYYGVTPDLTTFGKIVGGGMPLAAYGGKKEIMECVAPCGCVYQAGTLSGNPISVTAGIETLKILIENPDIYKEINKKAAQIELSLKKSNITVNRVGSLITPFFTDLDVKNYEDSLTCDKELYARYFSHMLKNGIYVAPSQYEAMFVSTAHDDKIIEKTCEIINHFC